MPAPYLSKQQRRKLDRTQSGGKSCIETTDSSARNSRSRVASFASSKPAALGPLECFPRSLVWRRVTDSRPPDLSKSLDSTRKVRAERTRSRFKVREPGGDRRLFGRATLDGPSWRLLLAELSSAGQLRAAAHCLWLSPAEPAQGQHETKSLPKEPESGGVPTGLPEKRPADGGAQGIIQGGEGQHFDEGLQ